jgi:transposase InsO family protein
VSELNLALLRRIDETYTAYPFFGSRRMTIWLRQQGYAVNRKRVSRLMEVLGLRPSILASNTSEANLRTAFTCIAGVDIVRPNQVWSTDTPISGWRRVSCIWWPFVQRKVPGLAPVEHAGCWPLPGGFECWL